MVFKLKLFIITALTPLLFISTGYCTSILEELGKLDSSQLSVALQHLTMAQVRELPDEFVALQIGNPAFHRNFLSRKQVQKLDKHSLETAFRVNEPFDKGLPVQHMNTAQVRALSNELVALQIGNPAFHRKLLSRKQVQELDKHSLETAFRINEPFDKRLPVQHMNTAQVRALSDELVAYQIENPAFHRKLLSRKQINQLSAESLRIASTFRDLPDQNLRNEAKKAELRSELEELMKGITAENKDLEDQFTAFLDKMNTKIPSLGVYKYFHYKKNIFTRDGLQLMIEYLARINPDLSRAFNEMKAIDLETLTTHLNDIGTNYKDGKFAYLIKHPNRYHITPVFISKSVNGVTVAISDSSGLYEPKTNKQVREWMMDIYHSIKSSTLKNPTIAAFFLARQSDGMSCPINSLLDLQETAKYDLFDYVKKASKVEIPNAPDYYAVDSYPPQYMKITQSLSVLDTYITNNHNFAEEILQPNHQKLKEIVDQHTQLGWLKTKDKDEGSKWMRKPINFYSRIHAYEYFNILLLELLK